MDDGNCGSENTTIDGKRPAMSALAIVMERPRQLSVRPAALIEPGEEDVVVDVHWSGISTGTERLLWTGEMPHFPGMGYPLVPGYESLGRVVERGSAAAGLDVGDLVFVPGARCFRDLRSLFGGAAARVVVPASRAVPLHGSFGEEAVLLALAATAHHAIAGQGAALPDLIVGHGVLGRLMARLTVAMGGAPAVWERDAARRSGASGYRVMRPEDDPRRDYRTVCDVSGDAAVLDTLMQRLAPGGEIVLAGFYSGSLLFAYAPAFMREARLRVSAEWRPEDLAAVVKRVDDGSLALDGLITHRRPAADADVAYRIAFSDPACLKMILDWRACS